MTAEEARKNRIPTEGEGVGKTNIINLLVMDYVNKIDAEIRTVSRYADSLLYPIYDLEGRYDVLSKIIEDFRKNGFNVDYNEVYYDNDSAVGAYTLLYISWYK
jgi:hypothetical protein